MKKISIELIKKIDFVLIFILCILGIVTLSISLFSELIKDYIYYNTSNQVAVIKNTDEKEVKEWIAFNTKIKDVFIFNVKNTAVKLDENSNDTEGTASYFSASEHTKGSRKGGITNLLFVKENNNERYKLFASNLFIYKYIFAQEKQDSRYLYNKNIYAVVNEDTNNDQTLNKKDRIALYISDYNGSNLMQLSQSVYTVKCTGDNRLLYTEYDGSILTFYEYDTQLNKKTKIVSNAQRIPDKEIILY